MDSRPSPGDWIPWGEAFERHLRDEFRTSHALEYHLRRRDLNGLVAFDAVRKSPRGHLIVNLPRLRRWLNGERPDRGAPMHVGADHAP